MKVRDISDHAALCAVRDRGSYGCSPEGKRLYNAIEVLMLLTGAPFKVALRKLETLERRKLIEYGTSINYPWLTDEGKRLLSALEAEDTFQRTRRGEAYIKGVLDTLRQLRGAYVTMNREIHSIEAVPANEKDGAGRAMTACITMIDRWLEEWIKVEESAKQPAASDPEGNDHG